MARVTAPSPPSPPPPTHTSAGRREREREINFKNSYRYTFQVTPSTPCKRHPISNTLLAVLPRELTLLLHLKGPRLARGS